MATLPPLGSEDLVSFGTEVTFGTAATGPNSHFSVAPIRNEFQRRDPPRPFTGATGASVEFVYDASRPRMRRTRPDISGPIAWEMEYEDIGWLLRNMFDDPTTTPDTPVVGAHTHDWTIPAALPADTPESLTIRRVTGQANHDLEYRGCVISSMEIRAQQDQLVVVTVNPEGNSGGDADVPSADEGDAGAPFIELHHSRLRFNSTVNTTLSGSDDVTGVGAPFEWTLRFDNNLRIQQAADAGGRGMRDPIYNYPRQFMLEFSHDFSDATSPLQFFQELFSASPPPVSDPLMFGSYGIYMESDTFITGSTPYTFEVQMRHAIIEQAGAPFTGDPGPLTERVAVRAGAESGLTVPVMHITLVNAETGYDLS